MSDLLGSPAHNITSIQDPTRHTRATSSTPIHASGWAGPWTGLTNNVHPHNAPPYPIRSPMSHSVSSDRLPLLKDKDVKSPNSSSVSPYGSFDNLQQGNAFGRNTPLMSPVSNHRKTSPPNNALLVSFE